MTYVTCRLTAKNRDQLRKSTLGNRVWAIFTFFYLSFLVFPSFLTTDLQPVEPVTRRIAALLLVTRRDLIGCSETRAVNARRVLNTRVPSAAAHTLDS